MAGTMNWKALTDISQLEEIRQQSHQRPQVIFKHSTRCSISNMVLKRLEREGIPDSLDFYFLDLIKNRIISNQVSEMFSVSHESPQVLLIKNGECVYDESHYAISMDALTEN